MNYEMELLNAIIESGDITLALSSNVESVFEVFPDVWQWVKAHYDKYQQLPDKDKVARAFSEFEYLNTSGSLQYYIDTAHNAVNAAKLKDALVEAAKKLQEDGPTAAISFINSTSSRLIKDTGKVKDTDLILDVAERVDKLREQISLREDGRTTLGISTGIDAIDFDFGGIQESDYIIILGFTASKKTWLSRLFAVRAWLQGYRPLVISLEMNKYQEGYRFDTLVNQGKTFRNSQLSHGRDIDPEEYAMWVKEQLEGKHSFYLVTNEGLDEVDQNMVQAKIDQYNPDLVIVDYLGLMDDSDGGKTEVEKMKNISKAMKRMAVKNQVPIIGVSQVTMEQGQQNQRAPELWESAWSRQISFDADLVLALFTPPESHILNVIARKNRRGSLFAFNLIWNLDTGKIEADYDTGD